MARTLLGVAGFPVAHSRSPAMHNAALAELGLDWLYVPLPLPPDRLRETVRALPASGFRGINVTIPHKQAAHALADEYTEAAAAIGAANTLTFEGDLVTADNTDAGGLLDALAISPSHQKAVVLGAGGAGRAAAWALREAGAEVTVWNRTPERARQLAEELEVDHCRRPGAADILVNATSVGLDPAVAESRALELLCLADLDPPGVVVDLVYGGHTTPVTAWARAGGARAVEGLEVLVRQGARSLERWTGRPPLLEVMRQAASSAQG